MPTADTRLSGTVSAQRQEDAMAGATAMGAKHGGGQAGFKAKGGQGPQRFSQWLRGGGRGWSPRAAGQSRLGHLSFPDGGQSLQQPRFL